MKIFAENAFQEAIEWANITGRPVFKRTVGKISYAIASDGTQTKGLNENPQFMIVYERIKPTVGLHDLSPEDQKAFRVAINRTIGAISDDMPSTSLSGLLECALDADRVKTFGGMPIEQYTRCDKAVTDTLKAGSYKTQWRKVVTWYKEEL